VDTAHRLLALFAEDEQRIQGLPRASSSALRVFNAVRARPVLTLNDLAERAGVSFPTASRAVHKLIQLSIVRELTGQRRNRVFAYDAYLTILSEGTAPL
jgi:DNA-binding transcriptional regulator GbsR (MarR family)